MTECSAVYILALVQEGGGHPSSVPRISAVSNAANLKSTLEEEMEYVHQESFYFTTNLKILVA